MCLFVFIMIRRPPRSTRTDTHFPYTTLFRSISGAQANLAVAQRAYDRQSELMKSGFTTKAAYDDAMNELAKARNELANARAQSNNASAARSEEHTSELQSLMSLSYAVFCLKKKNHEMTTTFQSKIRKFK